MIFLRVVLALTVAATPILAAEKSPAAPPAFRAGAAKAVITPKQNMWMGGYAARTRPSDGTAQDLYAKVLAIADAQQGRFVFITVDAIGITRPLRKSLEARLAQSYRLEPHQFVITASHTHSGPEFRPGRVPIDGRGSLEVAQAYVEFMVDSIHPLVGRALDSMVPVRLGYARARAGFAMNRRLPQANGAINNAPNPDGPVDHDVPVLRVDDTEGKLRAILFGYACHNTTLTQTWYQFCGDYSGYAQQYLEEDHPAAVALFLTGGGGDQNPYPRGTLEHAKLHGRTLATAVEAALFTRAKPLTGTLRPAHAEIDLPYATPPTRSELERRLSSKDRSEAEHAQRLIERMEKEGRLPTTYPYPIQVLQLGDELKMIMVGGELVVDYSLRWKQQFGGAAKVWVAGYSNDIITYIPSERVLREGGYEGLTATRLGVHPGPWAAGLEDRIVGKITELAEQVAR